MVILTGGEKHRDSHLGHNVLGSEGDYTKFTNQESFDDMASHYYKLVLTSILYLSHIICNCLNIHAAIFVEACR